MAEIRIPMGDSFLTVLKNGTGPKACVVVSGICPWGIEGSDEPVANMYTSFYSRYTVYVFGWKKHLPEEYNTEDTARDVFRAMTALGITHADVIGVSYGAMVAMCLCRMFPAVFDHLVMASGTVYMGEESRNVFRKWESLCRAGDTRSLLQSFSELLYSRPESVPPLIRDPAFAENITPGMCRDFAVLCRALTVFDGREYAKEVHCPSLCIGGGKDLIFPPYNQLLSARLLGGKAEVLEPFGHAVYDESEEYQKLVLQFISE